MKRHTFTGPTGYCGTCFERYEDHNELNNRACPGRFYDEYHSYFLVLSRKMYLRQRMMVG